MKKTPRWKKPGWWIVLLVGIFFIGKTYYQDLLQKREFIAQVTPVIEKMRSYTEIDTTFLSGSLENLSKEIYTSPEVYLDMIRQYFLQNFDKYLTVVDIPFLRKELDSEILLKTLSLEEKVAQLFVVGFEGNEIVPDFGSLPPGGVIIMGRNLGSSGFIHRFQGLNKQIPLFVSIDQEGGDVARIPETLPIQSQITVEQVCPTYLERSEFLQERGINLNFGIVADVTNTSSLFIYPRVFRDEIQKKITDAVQCTTETLSTLKHFPGHGMVEADTHAGFAIADTSRQEREKIHLPPFVAGIQAGVDVMMMGHIVLPRLESDIPASLSPKAIQLLRQQEFSRLVITDDLGMLRRDYTEKDAIKGALLAGNDLVLLVNPSEYTLLLDYTVELVRSGVISETQINESLKRIFVAKNKIIKRGKWVPKELMR